MSTRALIQLLKTELDFVEMGGYDHAMGSPWRPAFIFEDSPICTNFRETTGRRCGECPLLSLAPAARRGEKAPCRHIPLNAEGQTLDSLYRSATQSETLETVREWLKATIIRLEADTQNEVKPVSRLTIARREAS